MPDEPLVVTLSGGYPCSQLDRLLKQLQPVNELREPRLVQLNLAGLVHLGPTAQAVVAAAFRRTVDEELNAPGSNVVLPRSQPVSQYLQRMDVLSQFMNVREEQFERRPPRGFRPVQHYSESTECYAAARELRDAIAEVTQAQDDLVASAIYVCLGELAENVVFHAGVGTRGFAAAQAWKRSHKVEVAIVDMGRGIRGSLTNNPEYADIRQDAEAIERAMEPMVTATPDRNTGLGLSLTRFMLRRNGGQLIVRSGEAAVYAGYREHSETCPYGWPGTIVTLVARTDAPLDVMGAWSDLRAAGYQPDDDN